MALFTSFQNILPDPNNYITYAGSISSSGTGAALGPGFTSVKFTSNQPTMMTRTNSGRVITRSVAAHSWKIGIQYNSLTREEFEPVFAFLMSRQGKLNPFFVELPQYVAAQDSNFASHVGSNPTSVAISEGSAIAAGRTYFRVGYSGAGTPRPGDVFTITDANNSNHTKAYQVTRVETSTDYNIDFDATITTTTVTSGGGALSLVGVASATGLSVGDILRGPAGIDSPTRKITNISGTNISIDNAFNFGLSGHAPVTVQFYNSPTRPGTNQLRVHFSPPLVYSVADTSKLDFVNPQVRVIQTGDVQEYSLGVDGLYKFNLNVEEAAP